MLADGIRAYAYRQSHMHQQFYSRFAALWSGYSDAPDYSLAPDRMVIDEEEEEEEEEEDELDPDEIVDESGMYI